MSPTLGYLVIHKKHGPMIRCGRDLFCGARTATAFATYGAASRAIGTAVRLRVEWLRSLPHANPAILDDFAAASSYRIVRISQPAGAR